MRIATPTKNSIERLHWAISKAATILVLNSSVPWISRVQKPFPRIMTICCCVTPRWHSQLHNLDVVLKWLEQPSALGPHWSPLSSRSRYHLEVNAPRKEVWEVAIRVWSLGPRQIDSGTSQSILFVRERFLGPRTHWTSTSRLRYFQCTSYQAVQITCSKFPSTGRESTIILSAQSPAKA